MLKTERKLLLILLLTLFNYTYAQVEFYHSTGFGFYGDFSRASGLAITYAPRINLFNVSKETTFSVGTNLALGVSGYSDIYGEAAPLLIDFPILAELNFGHGSNYEAESDWGSFIGIGYGYNRMAYENWVGYGMATSQGPVITCGFKKELGNTSLALRLSYLANSQDKIGDILGLGVLFNIAMY